MVLKVFIVAVVILALVMVLFFLFSVLLPAMKHASFSVAAPLFSESELAGEGAAGNEGKDVCVSDERAVVACGVCAKYDENSMVHDKTHSCRTVHEVSLSLSDCEKMCIGSGDCAAVCPQRAIVMRKCGKRSIAHVTDLCCGCGECVKVCPQHVIKMIAKGKTTIPCAAEKQEIDTEQTHVFGFLRGNI